MAPPEPPRRKGDIAEILHAFKDRTDDQPVTFRGVDFDDIRIFNSEKQQIYKSIIFSFCTFKSLTFYNCIFLFELKFEYCKCEAYLELHSNTIKKQFSILEGSSPKIEISDSTFFEKVEIKKIKCSESFTTKFRGIGGSVTIEQEFEAPCKDVQISFEDITKGPVKISDITGEKAKFQFPLNNVEQTISLENIYTEELELISLSNTSTGKIYLQSIHPTKLVLNKLKNNGFLNITKVKSLVDPRGSRFIMDDCSFGNAEFFDIDFDSYKLIIFSNCHLQNIVPVNIKWNFRHKSYSSTEILDRKELFRQLKIDSSSFMFSKFIE